MTDGTPHRISTRDHLREQYQRPAPVVLRKVRPQLDEHCRSFVAQSSMVMLATADAEGRCDVSPRGDAAGFVRVVDDSTLMLPDRPGNNRLDTLTNLLANEAIGLLFLVPGHDDTLRVNGTAEIRVDAELLSSFAIGDKVPASVLVITVAEAYLHCGRAFLRAALWSGRDDAAALPTMGAALADQTSASADERRALISAQDAPLY